MNAIIGSEQSGKEDKRVLMSAGGYDNLLLSMGKHLRAPSISSMERAIKIESPISALFKHLGTIAYAEATNRLVERNAKTSHFAPIATVSSHIFRSSPEHCVISNAIFTATSPSS